MTEMDLREEVLRSEYCSFSGREIICSPYLAIKVTGIRPMAPVLNTGPLEGI